MGRTSRLSGDISSLSTRRFSCRTLMLVSTHMVVCSWFSGCSGRSSVAHVAKKLGISRQCAHRWVNHRTRAAARSPRGHALGSSGTRQRTTLVNHLQATGGRHGPQTMCEANGMANATVSSAFEHPLKGLCTMKIPDTVALVTGGASGLGRATEALLEDGGGRGCVSSSLSTSVASALGRGTSTTSSPAVTDTTQQPRRSRTSICTDARQRHRPVPADLVEA